MERRAKTLLLGAGVAAIANVAPSAASAQQFIEVDGEQYQVLRKDSVPVYDESAPNNGITDEHRS